MIDTVLLAFIAAWLFIGGTLLGMLILRTHGTTGEIKSLVNGSHTKLESRLDQEAEERVERDRKLDESMAKVIELTAQLAEAKGKTAEPAPSPVFVQAIKEPSP